MFTYCGERLASHPTFHGGICALIAPWFATHMKVLAMRLSMWVMSSIKSKTTLPTTMHAKGCFIKAKSGRPIIALIYWKICPDLLSCLKRFKYGKKNATIKLSDIFFVKCATFYFSNKAQCSWVVFYKVFIRYIFCSVGKSISGKSGKN